MANSGRTTVVGIFAEEQTAQTVVNDLVSAGIPRSDIHLGSRANWTGTTTGTSTTESGKGGGFINWVESLFGANPSDEQSGHYAEAARRGNCVVGVTTDDANVDRVTDVMERYDVLDIDEQVAGYQKLGYTGFDANAPAYSDTEVAQERAKLNSDYIPVVREELKVGKREVQRGGVRVYSHVVEEPVEQKITLREEKVRIDRQPVDRPINPADLAALRDQTIEVRETAEEAVVSKTARIVEEVRVSKEATENTQTIRDTVRHTEVQTDNIGTAVADYESTPGYKYGYTSASDARYRGKTWEQVEPTLRSDYARSNPGSTWEDVKDSIRHGWNKVTGKA